MTTSDFFSDSRIRQARQDCARRFVGHAEMIELALGEDQPWPVIEPIAHQIAGTAGSFRFDQVHQAATTLLAAIRAPDPDASREWAVRLVEALRESPSECQ